MNPPAQITSHISQITDHRSRITHHASRITFRPRHSLHAFTLIELLTVIAIIALLAAMVFPITAAVNRIKIRSRTQAQLGQIETQIQQYKGKFGHYPPDNPTNKFVSPLYYELAGTSLNGGLYTTLDSSAKINVADVKRAFGVDGFVNCSKGGGGDDASLGVNNFKKGLKATQFGELTPGGTRILVCSIPWPDNLGNGYAGVPRLNPWRYVSSNPTNNPKSFDLWVDIIIAGKSNRICNWSQKPLIVNTP